MKSEIRRPTSWEYAPNVRECAPDVRGNKKTAALPVKMLRVVWNIR